MEAATGNGDRRAAAPVATQRADAQIAWYGRQARASKRAYLRLKVAQILVAAAVPVCAAADADAIIIAVLGALIVVAEGLQQLFQLQQNWTTYRATAEALKHERFLHEAHAGPYAAAARPDALLAERVEGLVSQEHATWVSERSESRKAAGVA
ncbi:MAG: DUF4231 domain-containing protein [Solirubrobacterales bacterium]|nr:DUF4231 domain-containing protein [Solirubrobacterales bacterium]